ncbi:MAG: hypothetical protein D6696_06115 [Acidobacteria bacterium]|nr:MAG: hypothetical protein D6696_06115 [Acidobacteriota bacterium]
MLLLALPLAAGAAGGGGDDASGDHPSRLSDVALPLQLEGFPERPKPLLELGEPFLGTGTLHPGLKLPTGAVWQPSLLLFGTLRSALQSFDGRRLPAAAPAGADSRISEWASRLDLFFNLQLSGSERLVVGLRSLDQDGRFTTFFFEHPDPALDGSFEDELDLRIETVFFEGDFGEIFPRLDRGDFRSFDLGFAAGRQPLVFQEGMLIQDAVDAVGVTRNSLQPRGTSNLRATFLYGWGGVNRGGRDATLAAGPLSGTNPVDRRAELFAVLTSTDLRRSTVDVDVAFVRSGDPRGGDLLVAGISAVQRLGATNASLRLLRSAARGGETAFATDGTLVFSELSWTPHHTHDLLYLTTFVADGEFSSAARGPAAGGPLGRAGINFAAVGLGSYGAPLSSRAHDVAGGAIGYQKFFAGSRKQLIVEAAGRFATGAGAGDAFAVTARYQSAIGRRLVVVTDGFAGRRDGAGRGTIYGGRLELLLKF